MDFDNDSAFMNEPVVDWCRSQALEVTRSRAYRKNDQAWVEQKNGAECAASSAMADWKAWRLRKPWDGSMPPLGYTSTSSSRPSS